MRTAIGADLVGAHTAGFGAALVDAEPTRLTIGRYFEVYNALGHGFLESVYV